MSARPVVEPGTEDEPTSPEHSADRERPWADEQTGLKRVFAIFAPLPAKPKIDLATREEIEDQLPDPLPEGRSAALIAEAQATYDSRHERRTSAETRAVTLQGAIGVAAGLILTGANFVLDPVKVGDRGWRIALTVCLAALLMCLVVSGWLATRATLTFFTWSRPQVKPLVDRVALSAPDAERKQLVELLTFANRNYYVAAFKLAQVKAAGRWFRAALALLALLAILVSVYVVSGPVPKPSTSPSGGM